MTHTQESQPQTLTRLARYSVLAATPYPSKIGQVVGGGGGPLKWWEYPIVGVLALVMRPLMILLFGWRKN